MDFYASLAPEYDLMTRFDERLNSESALLSRWADPAKIRSVLDAARGTGLHAILLAKMGFRVTGTDLSGEMLDKAEINARTLNVEVKWLKGDMRRLSKTVHGKFDLILCLGNSLPHLLTPKDLAAALRGFHQLLNPGGALLVQLLNYSKVLKTKERIIGIHRKEGKEFVRFYDFAKPFLHFNILTVMENGGKLTHVLSSTPLYPYRKQELSKTLLKSGFCRLEFAGDLNGNPFDARTSGNLIIRAFR